MSMKFQQIGLIGKPQKSQQIADTCLAVIDYLTKKNIRLSLDEETAVALNDTKLPIMNKQTLCQTVELIIVVGGDGSLLHAARTAAQFGTPVVGINRGHLGFLTDIKPAEITTKLATILRGDCIKEERFLLEAQVTNQPTIYSALNDIVFASSDNAHMMEFEVYIDDCFMCSERADGMIIATPTGSTAYALSGGGPIIHPTIDAIVLVPMFAHTLTSRPIVVPGNSRISLVVGERTDIPAKISLDGQVRYTLTRNDILTIQKKITPLTLLHPNDYDYFANVRSKLHWGKKLEPSIDTHEKKI